MKKVLTTICIFLFLYAILGACEDMETESTPTESTESVKSAKKVIVDNEYLKATYMGIEEQFGVVTMVVNLENKTDGEITVLPMDSSVDGTMVPFVSGIPGTMQAGKSFTQGWVIGSVPQKNVEFRLSVLDEEMSELYSSDIIKIEQ